MVDVYKSQRNKGKWEVMVDSDWWTDYDTELEAQRGAVRAINVKIKGLENARKDLTDKILAAT